MASNETTDELDAYRLELLRGRAADDDIRPERYGPGTFGCHEAMHMASVIAGMADERLCEHPAVLLRPDWFKLAMAAHEALFELYQAIGQAHLDAE